MTRISFESRRSAQNSRRLSANFVLCSIFVSVAQFCGSNFLLLSRPSSSCDHSDQILVTEDSINRNALKKNPMRILVDADSPEPSKNTNYAVDPDAIDCKTYMQDYRSGKIQEVERSPGFEKSYVTRTTTAKPFYWSTHPPDLDTVRASSFAKGQYYESKLSARIQEVFDMKHSKDEDSIFLDVGGNIGWFSLLAAAHGATKVYTFEPNPANLVRICESLSLNHWFREDRSKDIVVPVGKGVGDKVATQKLFRSDDSNPGSFSFSKDRALEQFRRKGEKKLSDEKKLKLMNSNDSVVGTIDLITLDFFAEKHGWFDTRPSIAFFKLDVEGFEAQIIEGAKGLFKSRIVELFDMEMKRTTTTKDRLAMLEIIFNSGYELYMHGRFKGPSNKVEKKYSDYLELASDIAAEKYGENLLFRRIDNWQQ